jgi:hypothetical protein
LNRGYIKLFRAMWDNPFWNDQPFSRGQAWVDLLLLANHKDSFFVKRGIRVEVKRGQVGHSIRTLAKRWGWSQGRTKRFINVLQNSEQIEAQNNQVTTLITIVNYKKYQGGGAQNGALNGAQMDAQTDPKQEEKNKTYNIAICKQAFEDTVTDTAFIEELKKDYSSKNVDVEIKSMREYLIENHYKRKGKLYRNFKSFMRNWMGNAKADFGKNGNFDW